MNVIDNEDNTSSATHYWLEDGKKYPIYYRLKEVEVWNAEGIKEIVTRPQYFGDLGWKFHTNEDDSDVMNKIRPFISVELKKVHQAWNTLYPNKFNVGDKLKLFGSTVMTSDGFTFSANDMTRSFGNTCSYSDIFNKLD